MSIPLCVAYRFPLRAQTRSKVKYRQQQHTQNSPVKLHSGSHSFFGHLLYVVTWTGFIGNLSGHNLTPLLCISLCAADELKAYSFTPQDIYC